MVLRLGALAALPLLVTAAGDLKGYGRLYYDKECKNPLPDKEDFIKSNGAVTWNLNKCQAGRGVYEMFTCVKPGKLLETVHNDSECVGDPLFDPIYIDYSKCMENPLMPNVYWEATWTGGCGNMGLPTPLPADENIGTTPQPTAPALLRELGSEGRRPWPVALAVASGLLLGAWRRRSRSGAPEELPYQSL